MYSAIIPAAGTGSRMGLGYNKLFYQVAGRTIIEHTVATFLSDRHCKQMILTVNRADLVKMRDIFNPYPHIFLVLGGATRQASIYHALESVTENIVLVHDGARPFVTADLISRCYRTATQGLGAVAAVVPKDTIKQRDPQRSHVISKTIPRDELVMAQTPQAFPTEMLRKANQLAVNEGYVGTDDASLIEKYTEIEIKIVQGDDKNVKFTTPEDIAYFEFLLKKKAQDVHF